MDSVKANEDVQLLVMQYHRVGAPCSNEYPGMSVSPEVFANQVRWLKARGFNSITPSQWSAARRLGASLPGRPVLLIFDDGYQELAIQAFPLLESLGVSCAVALVTSEIGGVNRWDVAKGFQEHRLLTASEIEKWKDRGVEFCSHSHTHADLASLSETEVEAELSSSKSALELLVGHAVTTFVYPYSSTADSVVKLTEHYYELAYSGIPGINTFATPRCLQRRVAAPQTYWRFRWVVASAGWEKYHRFREQLHGM